MQKPKTKVSKRLETLDYLRGFFIVVIIIDHLGRWPSLLEVITGQGTLWVNAACGFVIISGLLVGYVRGYKDRQKPLLETAKKLVRRALTLYVWLVLCTVVYAAITWYAPHPELLAWVEITKGDWFSLIGSAVTFSYTSNWVHFLGLYALFLFFSPVFIYLLRKKLAWAGLLLSCVAYIFGVVYDVEWLQWQILFFVPAIAGFYLESIQKSWKNLGATKRSATTAVLSAVTITTAAASIVTTKLLPDNPLSIYLNAIFSISPLSISVIILSFIWFIVFILLFSRFEDVIRARLGWLLHPFGTYSLTAYIIHPITIILMSLLFAVSTSILLNTLLGVVCVMGTWFLLRQPWIKKIIPR